MVRELSPVQSASDFQCAVSVRHRDPAKLRRVYAELVTKAGDDPDLPVVSETSENFISKLRIAVVPSSATPSRRQVLRSLRWDLRSSPNYNDRCTQCRERFGERGKVRDRHEDL